MKRIILVVLLSLIFACSACSMQTEYDNKTVLKIETVISGGEVTLNQYPTRTFDFQNGTVTDERILGESEITRLIENYNSDPASFPEYASVEEYNLYLQETYNRPERISTFTAEQADALFQKIIPCGFYRWADNYSEDDVSCGSSWIVTVTFADGVTKRTSFYYKHPKLHDALRNYSEIENAFIEFCGFELFMQY